MRVLLLCAAALLAFAATFLATGHYWTAREPVGIGRQEAARPPPNLELRYAAYLKGESATGIGLDRSGNQYIVGAEASASLDGPGFVLKLSPEHHVLYRIRLAGTPAAIAVDPRGNAYVVGTTASKRFTVVHAIERQARGGRDAFVTALNSRGHVRYSTYLGGRGDDEALGVALTRNESVCVTGYSFSVDWPVRGGLRNVHQGAYLARLGRSGKIVYSTFLGAGMEVGTGVAVDARGDAYVTGSTEVPQWVRPDEEVRSHAFVAKIGPHGDYLYYSLFLHGSGEDIPKSIAVSRGRAYVTGATDSVDWPLENPVQTSVGGRDGGFVVVLGTSGRLIDSTYLGGSSIALDRTGDILVTGASGARVPILHPVRARGAADDTAIFALSPSGHSLLFSTYLGGSGQDTGQGVAVSPTGAVFVVGTTRGVLPQQHGVGPSVTGSSTGFLVEVSIGCQYPAPALSKTPACRGWRS